MIVESHISIIPTKNNINYYLDKGYDAKYGKELEIKIEDLTIGSHLKVLIKCDYCGSENYVIFKNYIRNTKLNKKYCCNNKDCVNQKIKDICQIKYGVDNPFQLESVKDKSKNTLFEKYGVIHPMHLKETKEKIKNTCLEKYGVDNYSKTKEYIDKIKQTNLEKYGVEHLMKLPGEAEKRMSNRTDCYARKENSEYYKYRQSVDNLTEKLREKLFENWDGFDYYDEEYIKDNVRINEYSLGKNYPSIDHKLSVWFGFYNNIAPEIIADISNLCITKISINAKKWKLTEEEFKNSFFQ